MTASDLSEFVSDLHGRVRERLEAEPELMAPDAFVALVGEHLIDDGVLDDLETCFLRMPWQNRRIEVAGYDITDGIRFARVRASGKIDKRSDGDSKIASAAIHIEAELKLPEFIGIAIKCDDGQGRASEVAVAAVLSKLFEKAGAVRAALSDLAEPELSNWRGIHVGRLRPTDILR